MMKNDTTVASTLNTKGWKYFTISKLFSITSPASRSIKKYEEGEIPYVSSGSVNNGIISYLEPKKDEQIEKGNCITVSPLDGSSFYQEEDFLGRGGAGSAISLLYNPNLSKYNALFICTIIKNASQKFDYSDALTSDNLKNLRIKLPIIYTEDGSAFCDASKEYSDKGYTPDWVYMEKYMKETEESVEKTISKFESANRTRKCKISTSEWSNFPIIDFFELSLPKGDLQVKKVVDGKIPLITPSNSNNGLLQRISAKSNSTLYSANVLTVDMFGNAYYQEEDFFVTAHGHVNVLIPKINFNKYLGWFMASTIKSMFSNKYGFADMCTQKVLKKENIILPIDKDKKPNWKYMEDYMKELEKLAHNKIEGLLAAEVCMR